MSNKNRNYQNNGNQTQENTVPEVGNESFEGEVPMPEGKPVKDANKKGIKETVAEKWNQEHTITWSGKKIATRVGGFILAAGLGALGMWAYDRKKTAKDEEEYDYEDDVVAESEYRETTE